MAVCGDGGGGSRFHCDRSDDANEKTLCVVVQCLYEIGVCISLTPVSKRLIPANRHCLLSPLLLEPTEADLNFPLKMAVVMVVEAAVFIVILLMVQMRRNSVVQYYNVYTK